MSAIGLDRAQRIVRRNVLQAEVLAQTHLAGRIVRGARHHAAQRLLEMCEPFRLCEELGNAYSHVMAQDR